MISELQKYLKTHPEWREELTKPPYNLIIKENDRLVLFKYSQIDSDFSNPIVKEARGHVFDKIDFSFVARPFDKFFNYGEPNADELDWSKITVTEKIDGSLIKVFYFDGEWRVGTSGTIFAEDAVINSIGGENFRNIFDAALENNHLTFEELTYTFDKNNTYLFELVSPFTRVVIPYDDTDLYFLGSRNNFTGIYYSDPYQVLRIKTPKLYPINSLNRAIKIAEQLDWDEEGFVAFDGTNRVKIKSPAYVVAHHVRNNNNVTLETLIDVVRTGEEDEFLCYADEYKRKIEEIQNAFNFIKKILEHGEHVYVFLSENKKDLALKTQDHFNLLRAYWFKKYDNLDFTVDEYIKNISSKKLAKFFIEANLVWRM